MAIDASPRKLAYLIELRREALEMTSTELRALSGVPDAVLHNVEGGVEVNAADLARVLAALVLQPEEVAVAIAPGDNLDEVAESMRRLETARRVAR